MTENNERTAGLQIGLKNAEVALEHEQRITQNEQQIEQAHEKIGELQEEKADKSKLMAVLREQGWKAFGLICFAYMMAWGTGVISAIQEAFK